MKKNASEIQYIYLAADPMSKYTLSDFDALDNVQVVNKIQIFREVIKDKIARLWLANSVNNKINLPYKKIIYKYVFRSLNISKDKDLCVILTPAWFDKQLYRYLKSNYPKVKIVVRFGDKVIRKLEANSTLDLQFIRNNSDLVVVYDEKDARDYGFEYLPMGYSKVSESLLKKNKSYDVVLVAAAKDRLEDIKYCYNQFINHGFSCFFYIIGAKDNDRDESGIIYADKALSFVEYLSLEASAKCLLEILQSNETGRTFRMMEAIIYNKLLITNCPEILKSSYYNDNIHYFKDIKEIDFTFPGKQIIPNNYKGDFSPLQMLKLVEKKLYNYD